MYVSLSHVGNNSLEPAQKALDPSLLTLGEANSQVQHIILAWIYASYPVMKQQVDEDSNDIEALTNMETYCEKL